MRINSRLELPIQSYDMQRHHHRSLINGSQRNGWSQEGVRMSPVNSRVRTPAATNLVYDNDGHLASQ